MTPPSAVGDGTITTGTATPGAPGIAKIRAHLATPLFKSAYALLFNTGITSILGLVYWAVAAHKYPAAEVGEASSAISAMQLLSGIAQSNLNNALPRLLPDAGTGTRRLVLRSYGVAVGLSVLIGGGYAVLAAEFGWGGQFMARGPAYLIWFTAAVAVWSVFFLEDAIMTGLGRAVWVPVENGSFSIGKIVGLVVFAGVSQHFGIFGSFTIPVAIAIVPVNWVIFRRFIPRHQAMPAPVRRAPQPLPTYLAGEYIGGLANLATTTMLPLLVATQIGSVANAYFYSAWVVGSAFEYVLSSIAVSVVVAGVKEERGIGWVARRGALLLVAILIPAILITVAAAGSALSVLGNGYAAQGAPVLRLVAIAVAPRAIVSLSVAIARIHRDVRTMVAIQVAGCVLTLGLSALLLPRMGVTGAGVGYLIAQGAVALVLIPRMMRTLRTGPATVATGVVETAAVEALAVETAIVSPLHLAAGDPPPPPDDGPHRRWWRAWQPLPFTPLAVVAAVVNAACVAGGWHLPGLPLLAIAVLVWVPGAAVVGLLGIADTALAATLAVATSIAIETLGGETMVWLGAWHPRAAVVALMVVAAGILIAQYLVALRQADDDEPEDYERDGEDA